jgi:hypothetical protein
MKNKILFLIQYIPSFEGAKEEKHIAVELINGEELFVLVIVVDGVAICCFQPRQWFVAVKLSTSVTDCQESSLSDIWGSESSSASEMPTGHFFPAWPGLQAGYAKPGLTCMPGQKIK